MDYAIAKEKLHDYIEHAHQNKIMAIYTLLVEDMGRSFDYEDDEIQMLEQRSNDAFSGITKTLTIEEAMEDLKRHREK